MAYQEDPGWDNRLEQLEIDKHGGAETRHPHLHKGQALRINKNRRFFGMKFLYFQKLLKIMEGAMDTYIYPLEFLTFLFE